MMEGNIRECVFRHGEFTLYLGVGEAGVCYCSFAGSAARDRARIRREFALKGSHRPESGRQSMAQGLDGDGFALGGDFFGEMEEWLRGYFEGEVREMPFRLRLVGSEFEQRVWSELMNIGYGELVSYRTVAERLGIPGSVRAVANAIGRNHYSVLIPCHRVIRSDGGIGGYAGGVETKIRLIELEAGKGGLFK